MNSEGVREWDVLGYDTLNDTVDLFETVVT